MKGGLCLRIGRSDHTLDQTLLERCLRIAQDESGGS